MDCHKVPYANKPAASEALRVVRRRRRGQYRGKVEHHVYRCRCGAWHLTSGGG
jgi:hypothetical protein